VTKLELLAKVKNLPLTPGIYKFKDLKGEIIYVGKAKNLKSRVNSYFQDNLDPTTKTYALVKKIVDMEFVEVQSELEALLLEAELIRKHYPKYNIALKDDKSYLYIVIRNEKFDIVGKSVDIPKIITVRKPDLLDKDTVFGPYPDGGTAKYIVKTIRRIFPFRDCSLSKFNRYKGLEKPCLYGYIGLCTAPCARNISVESYRNDIAQIKKFLSGGSTRIVVSLKKEMDIAAKNEQFERAAAFRDILQKFEYVSQSFRTPNKYIENPYLVEDLVEKSLDELVNNVPVLKAFPKRIECYDISDISGKESVGSMVVATNGRIDNSEYRKFKIKLKNTPDDFGMMREVLERRLHNDWEKPDLIVLDGGKGQVSAVLQLFEETAVDIPVVGLAKRFETIVYRQNDEFVEKNLAKSNEGLKLLIRLRNEAHRFAQKYHHQLRLKNISK
jgi:excinuclease ABC subunit C